MTAAAVGYSGIRRLGSASRFVVFVVVLAFGLQSYITQTHIHAWSEGFGGIVENAATQSLAQHKAPLDNSPVDCPFCQAVALAGVFVASATPLLHLPFVWVKADVLVFTARAVSVAIAHDWQSRAPPRR